MANQPVISNLKKQQTKKIYQNRMVQHLLFWALSFAILLNVFAYEEVLTKTDYIYASIFHIPLMLAAYINLQWLIPKFLQQRKQWIHGSLVFVVLVGTAFFARFLFDHLVDYIFPGYYFISYYELRDYILFLMIYLFVTTMLKLSRGWFQWLEAQQQLNLLKEEKLTAELQALKSQINPHFLFNSLNSIYSLSLDNEPITPKYILKLSELLRFMLYEARTEKVLLKKEIHYLKNYTEIQKLRVRPDTDIRFEAVGDLANFEIAPLLLLPLVENGFKHGIKGDIEKSFIHIFYKIEKNVLFFSIKNNKGKVDKVEADQFKGIGLQNVQRRLELLYPNQHKLKIEDTENSFFIQLQITLK